MLFSNAMIACESNEVPKAACIYKIKMIPVNVGLFNALNSGNVTSALITVFLYAIYGSFQTYI